MTGIIDLMFSSSENLIEIWDWKSNFIDSDDKKKELIKHYELQMKIYSYFIACLYPSQSMFKARLLFTNLASEVADDDEWTHCFTWSKDELMSMREIIENNIAEIRNKLYFWLD